MMSLYAIDKKAAQTLSGFLTCPASKALSFEAGTSASPLSQNADESTPVNNQCLVTRHSSDDRVSLDKKHRAARPHIVLQSFGLQVPAREVISGISAGM